MNYCFKLMTKYYKVNNADNVTINQGINKENVSKFCIKAQIHTHMYHTMYALML